MSGIGIAPRRNSRRIRAGRKRYRGTESPDWRNDSQRGVGPDVGFRSATICRRTTDDPHVIDSLKRFFSYVVIVGAIIMDSLHLPKF